MADLVGVQVRKSSEELEHVQLHEEQGDLLLLTRVEMGDFGQDFRGIVGHYVQIDFSFILVFG